MEETTTTKTFLEDQSIFAKYQAAAEVCNRAMTEVIKACVDGAKVIDVCILGDKTIEEESKKVYNKGNVKKGVAFPTCVSPGKIICHVSPLPDDPESQLVLKNGNSVRIELAAHVDGYVAHSAHTFIIGATKENPVTGREADVIEAAHQSCEAIIRLLRKGKNNYDVTDTVQKLTKDYECVPIEGMISHQIHQFDMEGKKTFILNPSEDQRRQVPKADFEEGEVYVCDVLITTSNGLLKPYNARTTVFTKNKDMTYSLKMKTSRNVFHEINTKFGNMGFTLRSMEDEKKARMGITECQAHRLVNGYPILETKEDEYVAHFMYTVLLMPSGPTRITTDFYNPELIKSDLHVKNEEITALLNTAVKKAKKNKNKNKNKKKSTN